MVAETGDYLWSNYGLRMPLGINWLDSDPCFEALGQSDQQRLRAWQAFAAEAIPAEQLEEIRNSLQRDQLTGTERFVREIEQITGQRIDSRGRERPEKEDWGINKSTPFSCPLNCVREK